jgi:hypothetical protein
MSTANAGLHGLKEAFQLWLAPLGLAAGVAGVLRGSDVNFAGGYIGTGLLVEGGPKNQTISRTLKVPLQGRDGTSSPGLESDADRTHVGLYERNLAVSCETTSRSTPRCR